MSPPTAVNVLWLAWYVTWIAAVVWSAKTKRQMRSDMGGLHRYLSGLGCFFLFAPSGSISPLTSLPVIGVAFERLWRWPDWVAWTLVGLVVLAFGFCWWARLHLGRLWSGFVTLKEDHRIIDTGPYGLVRHPIYTGVMAAAFFTALTRGDVAALIGFGLITLGFAMTARIEEGFLSSQLGAEGYAAYRARVPMLVPRIG